MRPPMLQRTPYLHLYSISRQDMMTTTNPMPRRQQATCSRQPQIAANADKGQILNNPILSPATLQTQQLACLYVLNCLTRPVRH
ncbi:hypothetical protein EBL85_16345 [Marichromatium sp. AB32]|nr:hypothetical protein EBL85_16345 [Marichromatium sp. AB32]